MNLQSLLAGLVHGLRIVSLAAVIGGLVFEQLIIPAGMPALATTHAWLRRWITACLVVLGLTTMGEIVIRTQAMSRAPLATAIVALPDVLARTHFGLVLTVRSAALVLAVLLSLAQATALRTLCLLVVLGVALVTNLTSHAADWGDLTISTAVAWMHTVAASVWAGGLLILACVVLRQKPPCPPAALVVVARRFSRLAGACLLAVVLTGSYNAWSQLGAVSRLWTSPYGRVLLVKLLVVAVLVGLGAVNRYVIIPRLRRDRASRSIGARLFPVLRLVILGPRRRTKAVLPLAQLSAYVAWEALLALVVFACTAVLSEATPGRHTAFERKL
jgi:copper resistance protein D